MDPETAEIIASVAKGTTEGFLNWSDSKVKKYVEGFKNKKFQFLEDPKMIERVKRDYNSGEISFYDTYIDNKEKRMLLSMGITLRSIAPERRSYLVSRIVNKYQVRGLHVAYISQNEMLIKYIGFLIPKMSSIKDLKNKVSYILDEIDIHAIFIKSSDDAERVAEKVRTIMDAHSPSMFVIDGVGVESCKSRKVFELLKNQMTDYDWSIETTSKRELFLFKRK